MASNDVGGQKVTSMTDLNFSSCANVFLFNFCLNRHFDHFFELFHKKIKIKNKNNSYQALVCACAADKNSQKKSKSSLE